MARIGIESGKQCWSHIEIKDLLEAEGFQIVDMLPLVQMYQPAMRVDYQKHAEFSIYSHRTRYASLAGSGPIQI